MAEDTKGKAPELTIHEPDATCSGKGSGPAGPSQKRKGAWTARLAFLLALVALFLSMGEKFSTEKLALDSINQMITDTVVPKVKTAHERDVLGSIYDLKRVMVTLEEIKETTTNEEVKVMVDQIRKQIEELNVKLFIHE